MNYPAPIPDDMSDREFIETQAVWPMRDRLPLKTWKDQEPEHPPLTGFLLAEGRVGGWTVYSWKDGSSLRNYKTLDDLLADGWVVD